MELRETFPFMKMLLLAALKGGIKGFNKCNLLFITAQNWSYFGVKWVCSVGKYYRKSLSYQMNLPQRGILEQRFGMGRVNLGSDLRELCVSVPCCFFNPVNHIAFL